MWLASFTCNNVFKVHKCVAYISSSVFVAEEYSNVWILFIHLSVEGHLSYFHFCERVIFTIVDNAAINIHVQIFVWTYVFIPFRYIPRSEIDGSYGDSILNYLGTRQTVFQGGCTIFIPTINLWGFHFLHTIANICYCLSFWNCTYSSDMKLCFLVVLFGISLMANTVELPFMCLLAIYTTPWKNAYSKLLPSLKLSYLSFYYWVVRVL